MFIAPPANDAGFEPTGRTCRRMYREPSASIRVSSWRSTPAGVERDPRGCIDRYRVLLGTQPGFAEAIIAWPDF